MVAMANEPAMSGEIPVGGVVEILREIEERRITGRLRFTAEAPGDGQQTGEVELVAGQIALDQDSLPDGSDPVEILLQLRSGLFVVHQKLPPLPVSRGDDLEKKGSLAVHVPADLMNYCESVGLTGLLRLTREGEVAELIYEFGELLAIRIDGREDGDLGPIFAWDEGNFHLKVNAHARSLVPEMIEPEPEQASAPLLSAEESYPGAREPTTQFVRPTKKSPDDTGRHFLKVVEVALTDIVDRSQKARPRTSPPRAPMPTARPRPPTMPAPPAPRRRREPTVRVVYLTPDDPTTAVPAQPSRTVHAARGGASGEAMREDALPDARPERRSETTISAKKKNKGKSATAKSAKEAAPAAAKPSAGAEGDKTMPGPGDLHHPTPQMNIAIGLGWVAAAFALGLFILAVLARLPPVQ